MIGDLIRTASGTISAFKDAIVAIATDENSLSSSDFNRLPELLRWNWDLVPNESKLFVAKLCDSGQQHLFASWDPPGTNDDKKVQLIEQLAKMDSNIIGGLEGYIKRAKGLLKASKSGENPFEGWRPE
eukprot:gene51264-62688_t